MRTRQQPVGTAAQYAIIRFALFTGVVLFGAVVPVVHRQPNWQMRADLLPLLAYVAVAVSLSALVTVAVIRGRIAAASDRPQRIGLRMIGWAVGEGAGLFGAVVWLLTEEWRPYIVGLIAMAIAFAMLPIKADG